MNPALTLILSILLTPILVVGLAAMLAWDGVQELIKRMTKFVVSRRRVLSGVAVAGLSGDMESRNE